MVYKEGENLPKPTFTDVPVGLIRRLIEACSGHGILSTQSLIDAGIPEGIVAPLERTNETNIKSPSSTIFANGGIVGAAKGIYDMELLEQICKDLGIDKNTPYMGRGSQARELKERINKHFETSIPAAFK